MQGGMSRKESCEYFLDKQFHKRGSSARMNESGNPIKLFRRLWDGVGEVGGEGGGVSRKVMVQVVLG